MKKTEKIKDLQAQWEETLTDKGLGLYPSSQDALNPFRSSGEYNDAMKAKETPSPSVEAKPVDPDLIARIDPACDPRSGGIGGYGSKGLKAIRDAAGFTYNPTSFHAKIASQNWDFVYVISSAGITVPRSVDSIDTVAFYTHISSARSAGEAERASTKKARRRYVPGWFKTDPSSGSNHFS